MDPLQEWITGKPFFIAFTALMIFDDQDNTKEYFSQVKDRKVCDYSFPLPHLPTWHKMYRSHHIAIDKLTQLILNFSGFTEEHLQFADDVQAGFAELKKLGNKANEYIGEQLPKGDELKIIQDMLSNVLDTALTEARSHYMDTAPDPEMKAALKNFIAASPQECAFLFLVHLPCVFLYRMMPTNLYRLARQGDSKALENLLRLDPLMLHDPMIGKRVQWLRMNHKTGEYEKLLKATLKPFPPNKDLKVTFAGFISMVAKLLKYPLTEPNIRALYDAIAQLKQGDPHAIDTGLPDSPEAFAKAIQRDRALWQKELRPDRKK